MKFNPDIKLVIGRRYLIIYDRPLEKGGAKDRHGKHEVIYEGGSADGRFVGYPFRVRTLAEGNQLSLRKSNFIKKLN